MLHRLIARFARWLINHLPYANENLLIEMVNTDERLSALTTTLELTLEKHADRLNALDRLAPDVIRLLARDQRLHETLTEHAACLDSLRSSLQTREQQEQREQWLTRLSAMSAEQRAILQRVTTVLESSAWQEAQVAVRRCATTLGFANPEMWVQYSRVIKADPGQAENVFRHTKAVHEVKAAVTVAGLSISNPDLHLLVELAYQGFAAGSV